MSTTSTGRVRMLDDLGPAGVGATLLYRVRTAADVVFRSLQAALDAAHFGRPSRTARVDP